MIKDRQHQSCHMWYKILPSFCMYKELGRWEDGGVRVFSHPAATSLL